MDTQDEQTTTPIDSAPLAQIGEHFTMRDRRELLEHGGSVPARDGSGRVVVQDSEGCERVLARGVVYRDEGAGCNFSVGTEERLDDLFGRDDSMVLLTPDLVSEESAGEMEACDASVQVDAIRRRLDRIVGLLRALPEGWSVERRVERALSEVAGHSFRVIDAQGEVRGLAHRRRRLPLGGRGAAGQNPRAQSVNWPGADGCSAGDAWAAGIALMLAAIDAEAHGDRD